MTELLRDLFADLDSMHSDEKIAVKYYSDIDNDSSISLRFKEVYKYAILVREFQMTYFQLFNLLSIIYVFRSVISYTLTSQAHIIRSAQPFPIP